MSESVGSDAATQRRPRRPAGEVADVIRSYGEAFLASQVPVNMLYRG